MCGGGGGGGSKLLSHEAPQAIQSTLTQRAGGRGVGGWGWGLSECLFLLVKGACAMSLKMSSFFAFVV